MERFLVFVYSHPLGKPLLFLLRMRFFSVCMGYIFRSSLSRFLIQSLIRMYHIDMSTYEMPDPGFGTLNDFFIRTSRPGFRTFPEDPHLLASPSDSCVEIFRGITSTNDFCVKGYQANLLKLFGSTVENFTGGDLLFCRLRFSDYHRFHFFDEGEIVLQTERPGPLYSVDASVLGTGLWIHNKSTLTHMSTKHFGEILWLEIGATNVGSIINNKGEGQSFLQGEEKGYFALGGSAILILFQPGQIVWSPLLLTPGEHPVTTGMILGHTNTNTLSSQ